MSKKTGNDRPIFILSCDRSGSSLLRRILDSHRNIACPPETKFIYQLTKVFKAEPSRRGLKDIGYSEADIMEQMRLFIEHFLGAYAAKKGKRRWAEKTPHNVLCVHLLDRIFGKRPRYIALYRHGLDVAHSFAHVTYYKFTVLDRFRKDGADTPMAAVRHWAVRNRIILDFAKTAGDRLLSIRYEDLTREPETVLKKVCAFLDEPWDPAMLRFNDVAHDPGMDDPRSTEEKTVFRNSGLYLKWPLKMQDALYREAQDVMDELGYAPECEAPVKKGA